MDGSVLLGILLGLVGLWLLALLVFWLVRPRGMPVADLLRALPDTIRMLRAIATDRSVPVDVRLAVIGLLLWIVSPIDLIPEFIPVLGPIDDIVVAVAALRYARRRLGTDGLRERWPGSDAGFATLTRLIGGR